MAVQWKRLSPPSSDRLHKNTCSNTPSISEYRKECIHCLKSHQGCGYPRGLCRLCYSSPSIRYKYPVSPSSSRGIPVPAHNRSRKPKKPTFHLPGTEEKIQVMHERALRGESLFHPLDNLRGEGYLSVADHLDIMLSRS